MFQLEHLLTHTAGFWGRGKGEETIGRRVAMSQGLPTPVLPHLNTEFKETGCQVVLKVCLSRLGDSILITVCWLDLQLQ